MKPSRPRTRFGFWTARMAMLALRHGMQSFWETLPVGQYDYPDWLYYGGAGPTQSSQALECFLPTLLDEADEVVHLDFHTGLGRWAECELLVSESEGLDNCEWWLEHFDGDMVRKLKSFTRAYEVRGGFGPWLRALFPDCKYRYSTAEFGTYSPMRVIGALADELRWHGEMGTDSTNHPSRRRLADTFVPRSRSWRTKTLHTGLSLVRACRQVLWRNELGRHARLSDRSNVCDLAACLLAIEFLALCALRHAFLSSLRLAHDAFEFLLAVVGQAFDGFHFDLSAAGPARTRAVARASPSRLVARSTVLPGSGSTRMRNRVFSSWIN